MLAGHIAQPDYIWRFDMKTLIDTLTKASIGIYDDAVPVLIQEKNILVGDPVQTTILDRNQANTILIENVTPPNDWIGWKYSYFNGAWTLNPAQLEQS